MHSCDSWPCKDIFSSSLDFFSFFPLPSPPQFFKNFIFIFFLFQRLLKERKKAPFVAVFLNTSHWWRQLRISGIMLTPFALPLHVCVTDWNIVISKWCKFPPLSSKGTGFCCLGVFVSAGCMLWFFYPYVLCNVNSFLPLLLLCSFAFLVWVWLFVCFVSLLSFPAFTKDFGILSWMFF